MFSAAFAYVSFFLFFGLIWLGLYLSRRDLRREMMQLSICCAPLGVLGEFFYRQDYYFLTVLYPFIWQVQAALIGFVYGGVAVALYAGFRHIYFRRKHGTKPKHPLWLPTLAVGGSLFMFLGMQYVGINSIYLSMAVLMLGGLSILIFRPDLLSYAIGSGVAVAVIFGIFYLLFQIAFENAIQQYWNTTALSWGFIWGIPVEELVWAFSWGFLVGPAYEFEFTNPSKILPTWMRYQIR